MVCMERPVEWNFKDTREQIPRAFVTGVSSCRCEAGCKMDSQGVLQVQEWRDGIIRNRWCKGYQIKDLI